jgi:hypothetical protein
VRWEELFHDLEGQLEAADARELAVEVADRTRREAARLRLVDRLRASTGQQLRLQVQGVGTLLGRLAGVGSQWVLVAGEQDRETLVPLHAVISVSGLGDGAVDPSGRDQVFARLGLGSALRGIARDRVVVTARLVDGSAVSGTVDRVGADYLELAEQRGIGEAVRDRSPRGVLSVPFPALAALRLG